MWITTWVFKICYTDLFVSLRELIVFAVTVTSVTTYVRALLTTVLQPENCFILLISTGKVTTVQRSMLSPGQRDENPGHHTSKQNVKTTSVCVSVLFSAATIVDLYSKNRALYCQNKIMLVCRIGSSLYSEKHFSANKNCTITLITRQHWSD